MNEESRLKILHPAPGSALARARDFGIDLTLILRNVALTPQERLEKAVQAQAMARTVQEIRETVQRRR